MEPDNEEEFFLFYRFDYNDNDFEEFVEKQIKDKFGMEIYNEKWSLDVYFVYLQNKQGKRPIIVQQIQNEMKKSNGQCIFIAPI